MFYQSGKSRMQFVALSALTTALLGCGSGETTNTPVNSVDAQAPVTDWQLVWSDEFDGNNVNPENWNIEVNCDGGGNQEKQCYTDDPSNVFVSGGLLNIVAKPAEEEAGLPLPYTSARLNTRGKIDFTYGRVEMRAKLPSGQGSWPAFWLLFSDENYGIWPQSGEIDIMEAVNLGTVDENGVEETRIYGTIHYGDLWPNNQNSGLAYNPGVNPADGFHTYAIEWQEGEIRWYMDDYLYATQRQSEVRLIGGQPNGLVHKGWYLPQFSPITGEPEVIYGPQPFDHDFHLILNLAVGGNWPENVNLGGIDAEAFAEGQRYEIDYVRVYECSVDPITGKGCDTVRNGWDQYRFEATDAGDDNFNEIANENGALVRGKAPVPRPPAPPTAEPLTIFADAENPAWPLWDDCCGPAESEVTTDDLEPERGAVAEFRILDNSGTVLGFNSRNGDGGPYNASALVDGGTFSFDMRVVSPPASDTTWLVKIEGNNSPSPAFEVPLSTSLEGQAPVVGQWQTYTFPVQAIADAGLDFSAIDVVMVFPAWQTGGGAVYRIDNVQFTPAGGAVSPSLDVFIDEASPDFAIWDNCCGAASSAVVPADDPERGNVVEFEILDGSGTVLGFNSRASVGSGVNFDATPIFNTGVLQFDLLVKSPPAGETTWLVKVEGNEIANPAFEVALTESLEGEAPVVGQWQTYTFPISAIADAGTDISAIDVILVFPAWQTGEGAVYQLDNVRIYDPNSNDGSSGGGNGDVALTVFADTENAAWPMWDNCCGAAESEVVMDPDGNRGGLAEFRILDGSGTVLGFNNRTGQGGSGEPFDATGIAGSGKFSFDLFIVSPPAQATDWLVKIEGNNSPSPAFEVNLNQSIEGAEPVVGEWQTFTFDILDIADSGTDISAIDVILVFPAWGTGDGAVYRLDNVVFTNN